MMLQDSPTLFWLVMTIIFTGLLWVPYIGELLSHYGPMQALRDPDGALAHGNRWAERSKRAHYNAVENLVTFAPLVILIHILNLESPTTAMAAMAYFVFRVGHFMIYASGIPYVRTVLFLAGFSCQAVLMLRLFGLV